MNLRGGVKVPTGGNAAIFGRKSLTSPRAEATSLFGANADPGEIPEPTVIVRMVEGSK